MAHFAEGIRFPSCIRTMSAGAVLLIAVFAFAPLTSANDGFALTGGATPAKPTPHAGGGAAPKGGAAKPKGSAGQRDGKSGPFPDTPHGPGCRDTKKPLELIV